MASEEKRVLVLDDQDNWRRMLKMLLDDMGLLVYLAKNRQEAEEMLKQINFDVGVFDVRLVNEEKFNVEGLGLLYDIKKRYPQMKTILMTGYPESIKTPVENLPADKFFLKVPENSSFDFKEFQQTVKNFLK